MSVGNAIVAGIIYALTEMLGLSGSGHLAVVNTLFDMHLTEIHLLFKAFTELAVMIAVILVYRKDIALIIRDTAGLTGFSNRTRKRGERYPEARLLFMLVMGTLPLLIMLPFRRDYFRLWDSTSFVGVMFVFNGAVLYVCERLLPGKKGLGRMRIPDALIIGICQAVAVIPGLSRLALTVTAGEADGFQKSFAIRFAMLLTIPAMFGASILSLADAAVAGIETANMAVYLAGAGAALVTAFLTVYGFRRLVHRRGYSGLAYYSLVIGVLTIILTLIF
ncbi:MAG: undecaprenyl-diphosphate phosphatase [Oscillospiraceae bacterium]|nr:undecaprenyl-diphosphate phosphatase [Oscillospiraceae bacterium]